MDSCIWYKGSMGVLIPVWSIGAALSVQAQGMGLKGSADLQPPTLWTVWKKPKGGWGVEF